MEPLISETLKTIISGAISIAATILTLFATQKVKQVTQENTRKQISPNEHIRLLSLKFVSVPLPTMWSKEWRERLGMQFQQVMFTLMYVVCGFLAFVVLQVGNFLLFAILLSSAILFLLTGLSISVGIHKEKTADQPIAEIVVSGSYEQIDTHVRRCLELLKARPQALIEESKTLVYKLDYGRFSLSRMMKFEYKELESDRWKLHIQCGVYDRDFQICKKETSVKDELNLKEFIAIFNISSVSTEKIGKLGALHGASQAKIEHKDVLPLIHTQVPDNLAESIQFGHDQK
jgi:hypothetical protein